ncbi:hypothetical protein SUDANB70_04468 [Streptomyces sp. enrichment culture]
MRYGARAGLRTGSCQERKLTLKFSLKARLAETAAAVNLRLSLQSQHCRRSPDRPGTDNAIGCEFESRLRLFHGAVVQRKNTTA